MIPTVGTAQAKLILVGEHWVLDGALALAVAVPAWQTRVTLQGVGRSGDPVTVRWQDLVEGADLALAHRMLELACSQAEHRPEVVAVASSVPVRRRLGSSAALAVALVRAFAKAAGKALDDETMLRRARQLEDCVHGTSSGLDPAAASADRGAVLFGHGEIVLRVPAVSPALAKARWVLADTGSGAATRIAIDRARAARIAMAETTYKRWRHTVDEAAVRAAQALEHGDFDDLAASLHAAGEAIEPLDIASDPTTTALRILHSAGAAAAKLTGAGLGGTVVGLARDPQCADRMAAAVRDAGLGAFIFPLVASAGD
ncbi:MAG: hypothetical protein FJ100_15405 [Deltaproteobacteria bacterium]|nr:hypothetical protein [Deltaproteobacteria bacterium]